MFGQEYIQQTFLFALKFMLCSGAPIYIPTCFARRQKELMNLKPFFVNLFFSLRSRTCNWKFIQIAERIWNGIIQNVSKKKTYSVPSRTYGEPRSWCYIEYQCVFLFSF